MKYSFIADYSEGAHPEILKYIVDNNEEQDLTYGNDRFCDLAADRIRTRFNIPNAQVQFVTTGTLANVVGLVSMLKPFEGVISPKTGHINRHEAGALEAAGYKIIPVESNDGKLTPDLIDEAMLTFEDEHTVVPRVVYVTQSTELATLYSKTELEAVIAKAKSLGLYVFVDGARLPMAFASPLSDITPEEFGALGIDMFYIGGTKNGGLIGEAIVVLNDDLKKDIRNHMKQRGTIPGKTRIIGQQFARFFDEDDLWLKTATHACDMTKVLYDGLIELGVEIQHECAVNQVFPIFDESVLPLIEKDYGFEYSKKYPGNERRIRLVTSWVTPQSAVEGFLEDLSIILTS